MTESSLGIKTNPVENVSVQNTQVQAVIDQMYANGAANVFMVVFVLLIQAMNDRQQAVVTDSKGMMANASLQNYLNQQNASIQFGQIPVGATNGQIAAIQAQNEEKSKLREDYQNDIVLARQTAQVQMTNTNTDVGQVQQDASEDTGWLQTLNTIGQLLAQMLKR